MYKHSWIHLSQLHVIYTLNELFVLNCTGPLPHTVIDFWQLVWQEKVNTVAMVTNLKEGMKVKCEQYWPEQGHNIQLGPYMVTNVEQQCFPYYIIRKLLLKVSILWI